MALNFVVDFTGPLMITPLRKHYICEYMARYRSNVNYHLENDNYDIAYDLVMTEIIATLDFFDEFKLLLSYGRETNVRTKSRSSLFCI